MYGAVDGVDMDVCGGCANECAHRLRLVID